MQKPPVIIIGTTRSGTTMLGRLLGEAPDTVYWHEPITVWRIGHAYRSHHRATAADATPAVKRRIHKIFQKYQRQNQNRRIVEKTPLNVLRIPFVHAVFPESKIIHIYRDGRANLRSQVERATTFHGYDWKSGTLLSHIWGRRLKWTPWWELPAYLPRALHGVWNTYVTGQPVPWFGIRYPGWTQDRKHLTKTEIAAKQWAISMETAMKDFAQLPDDTYIHVKYEDVIQNPRHWFEKICSFADLPAPEEYLQSVTEKIQTTPLKRWKQELSPEVLQEAAPYFQETLSKFGYGLEDKAA